MEVISTVTVRPDHPSGVFRQHTVEGGEFRPGSFAEWLGHHIHVAGLDPHKVHTLRGVEIVDGPVMVLDEELGRYVRRVVPGGAAVLTVHTEDPHVPDVGSNVHLVAGHPRARIKIVRQDTGEVLLERGLFPAPLTVGQRVDCHHEPYQVIAEEWPNRHPDYGTSNGREDYQLVTVAALPVEPPVVFGVEARAATDTTADTERG